MRLAPLAALTCAAFLAFAGSASAQIFTVTTTDDDIGTCDPGDCSIREALAAADAHAGEDSVSIPAGHYVLTKGALVANADETLNVVGHNARDTTIDGNGLSRVFDLEDGTVNMSHLTITGGHSSEGQGGGIYFDGTQFNGDHLAVVGNTAVAQGSNGGQGGGIFGDEAVKLTNSLVAKNIADGTGATFSGGQGGGIFGNEAVVLTNVTLSGNKAKAASGATHPDGQGGGIFVNEQGTVFTNVTISGNDAAGGSPGGGVFVNDPM